ncbi:hypothetical protein GCM10023321_70220 [Pseudonocardia eucalypti]|uniref:Uncharacterized protein n=1 Tax=Pseudonocardia eucalypti TaxID=648755 RepID=A0ABP9R4R5_9PSEU
MEGLARGLADRTDVGARHLVIGAGLGLVGHAADRVDQAAGAGVLLVHAQRLRDHIEVRLQLVVAELARVVLLLRGQRCLQARQLLLELLAAALQRVQRAGHLDHGQVLPALGQLRQAGEVLLVVVGAVCRVVALEDLLAGRVQRRERITRLDPEGRKQLVHLFVDRSVLAGPQVGRVDAGHPGLVRGAHPAEVGQPGAAGLARRGAGLAAEAAVAGDLALLVDGGEQQVARALQALALDVGAVTPVAGADHAAAGPVDHADVAAGLGRVAL